MQIESKKKKLCLEPLRGIITQGEKMADTVTFRLPATYGALILSDLSWQIRAASEKNTLVTADLTASASGEFCLVQWEVSADFTAVSGALSLMLVGTDSEGNVVIKFPGDDPIWVRDAETGQYSPPEDAIQKALNGLQQAESALEDATKALQGIGINFKILGHYGTLPELEAAVTNPSLGDAYGVGDPTAVYVWNGSAWAQLPGVLVSPSLPMSVANGGTGGTTVTQALANLGAQASNNLLVNPRFKYNSRDQQSYNSSSVWSVDGWKVGNGTISVIASEISISNPGSIWQPIKNENNIFGKQAVFSVKDSSGNIYTVAGMIPSSATGNDTSVATTNTPWGSINIGNSTAYSNASFSVSIYAISDSVTITAAKLELGSVSTLQAELDNPPPEDVEKLKLDMYDLDPGRCAYLPWHNENLLDNWYFVGGGSQQGGGQFPINQRGQTSYTAGDYQYCIDRWIQDGENVTIVDNGVKIEAQDTTDLDNKIYQCIESVPHNVPLTFSAIIDNKLYIVQGMSLTRIQNIVTDFVGIEIGESNGYQYALIRNTQGSITIQAVKLERGFLSTLASKNESGDWVLNDAPPSFQQELAKCQRYQVELVSTADPEFGAIGMCMGNTGSGASNFSIAICPLPVPMRIKPTVITSGLFRLQKSPNTLDVSSIAVDRLSENAISLNVTVQGTVSAGEIYQLWYNPGSGNCSLLLDANL